MSVSVRGLTPAAASGGHSSSRCVGLSLSRPLLLRSTGSRRAGSGIVAHGPSCSTACGILPDQGLNPCPLHWQADSQPLRHQGSPHMAFFFLILSYLWTNSPSLFGIKYDFFISASGWGPWSTISTGCEEDGKLGLGKNESYCQVGSTFRTQKTESASESVVLVCQCGVEWPCHHLTLHSEERPQRDCKPCNHLHRMLRFLCLRACP